MRTRIATSVVRTISFSIISIFVWHPAAVKHAQAQGSAESLKQRLFVESYLQTVSEDPFLYLKHLAYFNEAITRSMQNTPQKLAWNRAKRLMDMRSFGDAIETYFGNGSPIGVGVVTPGPLSISIDLKPVVVSLARRFMSLAPLSDEEIYLEAKDLVSNKYAVRRLAETLYKARYGENSFEPFNELRLLLDDLTYQPDQPPEEYFDLFGGAATQARLMMELDTLPAGEQARIRTNWKAFGHFINRTIWGASNMSLGQSGLDRTTSDNTLHDGAFDLPRLHNLLLQGSLSDEFSPFLVWWEENMAPNATASPASGLDSMRSRFDAVRRDAVAYESVLNSLVEISDMFGAENQATLLTMRELGEVAFSVEMLKLSAESADLGGEVLSSLEKANLFVGVYRSLVAIWKFYTEAAPIDVEYERFFAVFQNQLAVLDSLKRIEEDVNDVQIALASMQRLIVASEFRVRRDIEQLAQQVAKMQRQLNSRFSSTDASLEALAQQPAYAAARTLATAANEHDDIGFAKEDFRREYGEVNEHVLMGVARAPFVTPLDTSWKKMRSARSDNDSSLFSAIASVVEAADFYDLSRPRGWLGFTPEQKIALSEEVRKFLAVFPASGPLADELFWHHNESAFFDAINLAADVVARVDPELETGFSVRSYREAHQQNQEQWKRATAMLPVILFAAERDISDLLKIWNSELSEAVAAEISSSSLGEVSDLLKHAGIASIPRYFICLDALDDSNNEAIEGDEPTLESCEEFKDWIPSIRLSHDRTKVLALQSLGILEPEPHFEILNLNFERGNWDECTYVSSYCRTNCVKVIGGYRWMPAIKSRYKSETERLGDLFDGYASGVREVCNTYPPAGGPTLDQASPGVQKRLLDLRRNVCMQGARTECERMHDQIFREVFWTNYFLPDMKGLFWASSDQRTLTSASSHRSYASMEVYPVSIDLSRDSAYEQPLAAFDPMLDTIVSREVDRLKDAISERLQRSNKLWEALEFVEDDLWAIYVLISHMSPACIEVAGDYLVQLNLERDPSGRVSVISHQAKALIDSGQFEVLHDSLMNLYSVAEAQPSGQLLSAVADGNCYLPSTTGIQIDSVLTFLEAVDG